MADNNQQTLDSIRAIEARINTMFANIGRQVPRRLLDNASLEDANESLRLAEGYINRVDYSATSVYNNFRAITSELKSSNFNLNQATKSLKQQEDISQKLMLNERGIGELSLSELEALKRKQGIQEELFKLETDAIVSTKLKQDEVRRLALLEQRAALQSRLMNSENEDVRKRAERQFFRLNDRILEQIESNEDLSEKEKSVLKIRYDQNKPIEEISNALENQIALEEKITSRIGLAGAAFDNLNKIGVRAFGGLGINLGTLQRGFTDATKAMRAEAMKLGDDVSSIEARTKTLAAGARELIPVLKEVFTDPLILSKILAESLFDIDKAATNMARATGQSFEIFDGITGKFATAVDLAEVLVAETEQAGLNANNIFSNDVLYGVAEFKNMLGGSAEEMSGLLNISAATNMSTKDIQENIVDTTSAFNEANRSAVSQRAILKDVLSSSLSIQASLGANPKALAKAAAAARNLGLSLSEVDQIAESLLDFESSINNELEAQLLTGKTLNLAKARELALYNDIEGLSKEIFDNQVSLTEFSQMNRIQQEGLAKALGVSRDQLAKMAFTRAKINGLTDKEAAKAAGISLSDMQRAEAIDSLQRTLTSLLQVFAPILDKISSFFGLAAQFPGITKTALALGIAFKTFGNPLTAAASGIGILRTSLSSIRNTGFLEYLNNAGTAFKDYVNRLKELASGGDIVRDEGLTDRLTGQTVSREEEDRSLDITRDTVREAGENGSEALESTQDLAPQKDLGEKIEEFLTGLSNGLKKMGRKGVFKGALNLIPASFGLVAMIPGTVGASLVSRLNGPALAAGLTGLGTGLTVMGTGKVAKGAAVLGLAALAFTALLPALPGMALLSVVGPTASAGLIGLGIGLALMGTGPVAKGAAVLGLAALSFIALLPALPGMALLSIVGPLASSGLASLAYGIGILQAVGAVPFLLSLAAVGFSIAAIFLGVGFAIKSAAEGISLLASSLTLDKVSTLYAAAGAIASLAGALTLFGTAGLLALPALLVVTPLLTALSPAGDAGEAEGQNTMAKVEEKLDLLIAAVKEDKKIVIDGRQLEEVITFR